MGNGSGPTQLEIFNMALGLIPVRAVTAVDEDSPEADACNIYWLAALRETLRSNQWRFANVVLSLTQSTTYTPVNWLFAYTYPQSCIVFWKLYNNTSTEICKKTRGEKFQEGLDATNQLKVILTNVPNAIGELTYPVTDTTLFDASFVTALSYRLAAAICPSLINDDVKTEGFIKLFNNSISDAQRLDSYEDNTEHNEETSSFVNARGGVRYIDPKFRDGFSTSQ